MPSVCGISRFIKKRELRISKANCDAEKGFPKIGGPIKPLCVHSVMISVLFLNFHVLRARWNFATGKEGKQSWHFELKVIVMLGPNLLRPGGQTWPSKTKFIILYSLRNTCPIKLNIATKK